MQKLNLPDFECNLNIDIARHTIFDPFRKKHVALTPEEWVRQNFVQYMVYELNYPIGLISTEMALTVHQLIRRCDIVAFDKTGKPRVIVECKAPSVKINQKTFDQIATYNLKLNVDYLIVTNGLTHYCCKMNTQMNTYNFQDTLPDFSQIL